VRNDDKIFIRLRNVSVKEAQSGLHKTITWIKKSKKGRQEWEQAHFESGMWHHKLKTLLKTIFTSKVIMFEETLEFKNVIILCNGRRKSIVLQQKKPKMWAIDEVINFTLNLVVLAHVMIRSSGH
jgi:hypothetical protein